MVYLITFSCYGTHLHGNERGSVDRDHNLVGSRLVPPDRKRVSMVSTAMQDSVYRLDERRREVVLASVRRTCSCRGWMPLAIHVRTTHVHCVLGAEEQPERVMNALKSHASRALNEVGIDEVDRKRWDRHGSTRYLNTGEAVRRAIAYVVEGQGAPMAVYVHPLPGGRGS